MRLFLIAFQFLTIIPLPVSLRHEKGDLGRSTLFFPLVGLVIGGIMVGANRLMSPLLPPSLCAALLIMIATVVTGALHLDGLADVCDGLAARGSRERFLEIMKDSRVGAVGVVGLVLGLLLKWQALAAIPDGMKWQALLLFPAMARFGQVLTMTGARRAKADGLGAAFADGTGIVTLALAGTMTAAASLLLLGAAGIIPLVAVLLCTGTGRWFFQMKLGGLTGDTIGCISELNEIVVLTVISALPATGLFHF